MRIRHVLTAVAAAVLLVLGASAAPVGAATPRAAASAQHASSTVSPDLGIPSGCFAAAQSPDGGAYSCFFPTGEHLYTCDTKADGHHPGTVYSVNGGAWHIVEYSLGKGNCAMYDLDLPEKDTIAFQACNYEGSLILSCSDIVRTSAAG